MVALCPFNEGEWTRSDKRLLGVRTFHADMVEHVEILEHVEDKWARLIGAEHHMYLSGVSIDENQLDWLVSAPAPALGSRTRRRFHLTSSLVNS